MLLEQDHAIDMLQTLNSLNESAIIAFTDVTGKILEVNDLFCKISGYEREELIGKDHRLLNSGHHEKEFFQNLWSTIRNGNIWTGEIKNRTKSGSYYWVHTVISPVKDQNGIIQRFMSIRFDITRQKANEAYLQDSFERWKLALGASGRGVWDLNILTGELHVSEQIAAIFAGAECKGIDSLEDLLITVHPEDKKLVVESIDVSIQQQCSFQVNHRILWSDGTIRWVNNRGDVIQDNGYSVRIVGFVQDITSDKLLEEATGRLHSSAKLTAIGEMACRIVHEINNPLTIILGRLTMLKMQLSDMPQPDVQGLVESIEIIESTTRRMASITKGLGTYNSQP